MKFNELLNQGCQDFQELNLINPKGARNSPQELTAYYNAAYRAEPAKNKTLKNYFHHKLRICEYLLSSMLKNLFTYKSKRENFVNLHLGDKSVHSLPVLQTNRK